MWEMAAVLCGTEEGKTELERFWDDPQFTAEEKAWLQKRAAERAAAPLSDLEAAVAKLQASQVPVRED